MFDVELYFSKSRPFLPHFLQLVTGFNILQQQKIIALHKHYDSTITFPFSSTFSAKINNKTNILFDICDGTDNFVLSDHIEYFKKNNITIFKRAYDPSLYRDFSFVRPLGLNYYGLYGLFQKTYLHFLYTQPFFLQ